MRRAIFVLSILTLLAACGGTPQAALPTRAPAPTSVPVAASATNAPVATTVAPATSAPTGAATLVPTAVPATRVPATAAPTTPAPTAIPATVAPTAVPATIAPATAAPSPLSNALLFLRGGALWSHALNGGAEQQLLDSVREFALSSDGTTLALIRGNEVWVAALNAPAQAKQLTQNDRLEGSLSWSPAGMIAYASSRAAQPDRREQGAWSAWCSVSEVRVLPQGGGAEQTLAPGCDPAWSPDGKRLAFAAPPTKAQEGFEPTQLRMANSIRLVNAAGQNGWNFAKADGATEGVNSGLLVHAPAWSPDGKQVLYHRFAGYQALVDMSLSEAGASFEGKGKIMFVGAGWQLPARYTANGTRVAIVQDNYSDARGFGGYEHWSVTVIALNGTREVAMPSGPLMVQGQEVARLVRAQGGIWSPDGTALAVQLPAGWRADLPNDASFIEEKAGDVWRWVPGQNPSEKLVSNVDFASPLVWVK